MANNKFSSDLINDILFRAGEPTDGTSDFESRALELLNRAYQALYMGGGEIDPEINEGWWWMKSDTPGVLTLLPVIEDGTVSVTNNNTAITFSSAPALDTDGYFFKVTDHSDVFRISAHTAADTAATLDSVYTGPTDSAASYKLFKLEYDLPATLLRVMSPMRCYADGQDKIEYMELPSLDEQYPIGQANAGVPHFFANVEERKVRFSHYGGTSSTDLIRVEYDYLVLPDDLTDSGAEQPLIPIKFRRILSDIAVMFLYEEKNDSRAGNAAVVAKNLLRLMKKEQDMHMIAGGRLTGKIYPRQDLMSRGRVTPLRTQSGVIIG